MNDDTIYNGALIYLGLLVAVTIAGLIAFTPPRFFY